jgi:hypothetical protein
MDELKDASSSRSVGIEANAELAEHPEEIQRYVNNSGIIH